MPALVASRDKDDGRDHHQEGEHQGRQQGDEQAPDDPARSILGLCDRSLLRLETVALAPNESAHQLHALVRRLPLRAHDEPRDQERQAQTKDGSESSTKKHEAPVRPGGFAPAPQALRPVARREEEAPEPHQVAEGLARIT